MDVSAVDRRRDELGQVVEPEPRRQLRHLPEAADHAAAEPGPAGADGRQRVHLAAGRVRLGRAGDPDQQQAGRARQADRDPAARPRPWACSGARSPPPTDRVGLAASGDAAIRYRLPEAAAKVTVTRPGRTRPRRAQPRRRHRRRREPGALGRPRRHRPARGRRQLPGPRRGGARRRHRDRGRAVPHRHGRRDRAGRRRDRSRRRRRRPCR